MRCYGLAICIGCEVETVTGEPPAQSTKVRRTSTCYDNRLDSSHGDRTTPSVPDRVV